MKSRNLALIAATSLVMSTSCGKKVENAVYVGRWTPKAGQSYLPQKNEVKFEKFKVGRKSIYFYNPKGFEFKEDSIYTLNLGFFGSRNKRKINSVHKQN